MFNQTKLEVKPSIRVAVLLSIPCIASLILITSAQIPLFITIFLICCHLYLSYQFISKLALQYPQNSIKTLYLDNEVIILEEKSGLQFIAKPLNKCTLYPAFTLLSFDCEKINNPNFQQEIITDTITTDLNKKRLSKSIQDLLQGLLKDTKDIWNNKFLSKKRRHLFICRYNAGNSSAFRRVRVWFKFNN